MEQSGLAAVAPFVMRDQQHLGVLRVREGAITLERMYFADEIRPVDDVAPEGKVDKRELEMAASLIEQFSGRVGAGALQGRLPRRLLERDPGEAEGQGR